MSGDKSADTPEAKPIRVLLVDDHRTLIWGLARLIETARPPMTVAGEATTSEDMLEQARKTQPDVIVLDLDLAGHDAVQDLERLRQVCAARVLILTGNTDPAVHQAALLSGARGVVEKSQPAEMIVRAIACVHSGEVWANRDTVGKLLGSLVSGASKRDPAQGGIALLTPREREIVRVVAGNAGLKGAAIADRLHMSESTLRNHLTVVYEKLNVRNRIELVLFARERGLADAGATAAGHGGGRARG